MPRYCDSPEYLQTVNELKAHREEEKRAKTKRIQLALLCSSVQAFNAWRKERPEESIDLSGVDLSNRSLVKANLSGVDLTGANLSDANLTKVNLDGADLSGCQFKNTRGLPDFTTPLAEVLRRSVKEFNARRKLFKGDEPDLSGQDFSGLDLTRANFDFCNLTGTDFQNAILKHASFAGATLKDTKFKGANVTGAYFFDDYSDHKLSVETLLDLVAGGFKDLSERSLKGQDLSGLDLTKCNLYETDLSHCILKGVRIHGKQLDNVDLTGATGTIILVK